MKPAYMKPTYKKRAYMKCDYFKTAYLKTAYTKAAYTKIGYVKTSFLIYRRRYCFILYVVVVSASPLWGRFPFSRFPFQYLLFTPKSLILNPKSRATLVSTCGTARPLIRKKPIWKKLIWKQLLRKHVIRKQIIRNQHFWKDLYIRTANTKTASMILAHKNRLYENSYSLVVAYVPRYIVERTHTFENMWPPL